MTDKKQNKAEQYRPIPAVVLTDRESVKQLIVRTRAQGSLKFKPSGRDDKNKKGQ